MSIRASVAGWRYNWIATPVGRRESPRWNRWASAGTDVGDPAYRRRGHLFAKTVRFLAGDTRNAFQACLEPLLRLTRTNAMKLHVTRERDFRDAWADIGLAWGLYF